MVDFCIRSYEGVAPDFVMRPHSAADALCGQEAVIIGAAWLDIYGRRLLSASTTTATTSSDGNGDDRSEDNKGLADLGYSENSQVLAQTKFDSPFVRIGAAQLGGTARITEILRQQRDEEGSNGDEFRRPSPTATFLHDSSQLYREDPGEGWEFQQSV